MENSYDYEIEIDKILKENLTNNSYILWKKVNYVATKIWDRPASSTGKYHHDDNGDVKTVGEHTFEMLFSAVKIIRLFNIKSKTIESDVILISLAFHDILKYGLEGKRLYTINNHDVLISEAVENNKEMFLQIFSEEEFNLIYDSLRYHGGRWSSSLNNNFSWDDHDSKCFFVHVLDMLSSKNLLKTNFK